MSKIKDLKLMKVIHDIKTPILSIKQIINSIEVLNNTLKINNSNSLTDALDELDNIGNTNSTQMCTQDAINIILATQKSINFELEDMEEMIENLKTEFKSKNQMQFKEEVKEVESKDFLKSLQNSHIKLAESAKNQLKLTIRKNFPKLI